eukprot:scaffold54160_cov118-Phaeocystis_antarctica.AAC.1
MEVAIPGTSIQWEHHDFPHPPLRGGRVEARWQRHSLSQPSRRRVGSLGAWLLGGSGGSDAAGAAAAQG